MKFVITQKKELKLQKFSSDQNQKRPEFGFYESYFEAVLMHEIPA